MKLVDGSTRCSKVLRSSFVASAMLFVVAGARAGGPIETVDDVVACARANLPDSTAVELIEVTAYDRAGEQRELEAKLHYKRFAEEVARIRARVENPAELRGAAYLLITHEGQETMYMYLPSMKKTRRVTGGMMGTRLWGTDFSYEDFRQFQSVALRGSRQREEDTEVDGRSVYVVTIRPDPEDQSSYEKIRWFVDRETCLPLRVDFYEYGEEPRKRLTSAPEQFTREGDRWLARRLRMEDLLEGTSTTLRVVEAEYAMEIPDWTFQPNRLSRER